MKRVHLYISGVVQGVSYRYWTRNAALELGLCGWVRNLDDGMVEAVAEGLPDDVDKFIALCRRGPRLAIVDNVRVLNETLAGEAGFEIKFD